MTLTLTLEPALVLLGQLDDLANRVLEGAESGEHLEILPQAQQDLQLFELLAQLQQCCHPVALRVGAHHEANRRRWEANAPQTPFK